MENATKLEHDSEVDSEFNPDNPDFDSEISGIPNSENVSPPLKTPNKGSSKGSFTKKEQQTIFRAITMMSQIAFTVIACVAVGLVAGMFLDRWLGTAPWLLIVFLLLGIISAFKAMIDVAKKF